MKKLPLAITTFEKIRDPQENYLYIDKTHIAFDLINNGTYYFLSRPRRFGKSLFIDTLGDIFQAKKSLFKDLAIYNKWDWDIQYPVIKIDFNTGNFTNEKGITNRVFTILENSQQQLGITCEKQDSIPSWFEELILKAYEKHQQKLVILIDEYDKPILDNIGNKEMASTARDILRYFYGVIKSADRYIKFVFMTGVSKFAKMHLFSGLNNLEDITLKKDYATLCGFTHQDIKTHFQEHLKGVDLEKVKQWYNGYNYFGELVYNPYDILLFVSNHYEYKNYWWSTGNPKFLIDTLKTQTYYIPNLENIITTDEVLNCFDVEYIDLVALLWQTGYLTFDKKINKRDKLFYQLKVPNKEIQSSLNELFITYLTNQTTEAIAHQDNIYDDLTDNLDNLKHSLNTLFASIPYNNYANNIIANYEGYYSSVVYTYLVSLGFPAIAEDVTNRGRIDLTIKLTNRIIIFEFKVDVREKALQQIKDRKYYEKYKQQVQEIFIVGICFDSKEKNITDFEWEKIE